MPGQGTTLVDFGAFPGAPQTSVAVTGQSGIKTTSLVECWVFPAATADHSVDEHIYDPPRVTVSSTSIVANTGFTITAVPSGVNIDGGVPLTYGKWNVAYAWSDFPSAA